MRNIVHKITHCKEQHIKLIYNLIAFILNVFSAVILIIFQSKYNECWRWLYWHNQGLEINSGVGNGNSWVKVPFEFFRDFKNHCKMVCSRPWKSCPQPERVALLATKMVFLPNILECLLSGWSKVKMVHKQVHSKL